MKEASSRKITYVQIDREIEVVKYITRIATKNPPNQLLTVKDASVQSSRKIANVQIGIEKSRPLSIKSRTGSILQVSPLKIHRTLPFRRGPLEGQKMVKGWSPHHATVGRVLRGVGSEWRGPKKGII